MLKKTYKSNGKCQVTFRLSAEANAKKASLCGEFNDWEKDAKPMRKLKSGEFSVSLTLEPGKYRFRYWLDGERWENDWEADEYLPNEFGTEDSVVSI